MKRVVLAGSNYKTKKSGYKCEVSISTYIHSFILLEYLFFTYKDLLKEKLKNQYIHENSSDYFVEGKNRKKSS